MHDSESDTFVYKTWPEKFSDMLKEIGVDSESKEIGTYDIEKGEATKIDIQTGSDVYIPKMVWTKNMNKLCVFKLNRYQNEIDFLLDIMVKLVEVLKKIAVLFLIEYMSRNIYQHFVIFQDLI